MPRMLRITLPSFLLAALVPFLMAAQCNQTPVPPVIPSPGPPPGDTTAPTIVSVTPGNGEIGVTKDVKIVVTFSEAMNKATTELAYQSSDMPAVSFAWSDGDTKLTIDPTGDLAYSVGGTLYSFKLTSTATDLAGNALTEVTSTFRTLRELTRTFESVAVLDGDVRSDGVVNAAACGNICVGDSALVDNAQYKGFLSFNLTPLATDGLTSSSRITSAVFSAYQMAVDGAPYTDLILGSQRLLVAHVNYGPSLTAPDFNTPILSNEGNLAEDADVEWKAESVVASVRDDWDNRAARDNRSQYMLYFAKSTDGDGIADIAYFSESGVNKPELTVKFLVP